MFYTHRLWGHTPDRDRLPLSEVDWLIDPTHHQQSVRHYDSTGDWISLTLIQQEKINASSKLA